MRFLAAVLPAALLWCAACSGGGGDAADAREFIISPDGAILPDFGRGDADEGGERGEDASVEPGGPDGDAGATPDEDRDTPPTDPGPDPVGPDPGADPAQDPTVAEEVAPVDTAPPDFGPCDPDVTTWGYRDNCDGTVTDTINGFTFTKGFGFASDLLGAVNYCKQLALDGGGWRLPEIEELRSLIIGCDKTDMGGACKVADGCIDDSCWNAADCDGCGMGGGPGTDGCYMDPVFDKYCHLFWSASEIKAALGIKRSWYVTFYDARVYRPDPGAEGSWAVRCVR